MKFKDLLRKRLAQERRAMPKLGVQYRDVISGYTGWALGYVQYVTGCNQLLLQMPMKEDGTFQESRWFDEERCEHLPELGEITLRPTTPAAPLRMAGGDREAPRK